MDQTNAIVLSGGQALTLQSETLPDVRTLLTDDQRKSARSMALALDLANTRMIMDFGSQISMAGIAKEINERAKVGDVRGTPAELVLRDLGVIKEKFDPTRLLNPKLMSGFMAVQRLAGAIKAYTQDWNDMQKVLDEIEARLVRVKQDEGTSIDQLDGLRNDCVSLYDQFTVLEAGYKYLIQRMINAYNEKKAKLTPGDQRAEQELADLGDYIGMVDRSTFDTHYARARVIVVGTQIRMMRKADEEMYRMFSSQISTAMPMFRINMALAVKLIQDKKALDTLQKFKDQDQKQAQALNAALGVHLVAVAQASEDNSGAVQQLLSTYKSISDLTDQVVKIHDDGIKARADMTGQINAVMVGMQKKVTAFDPTKLLDTPADLKDVPLTLDTDK